MDVTYHSTPDHGNHVQEKHFKGTFVSQIKPYTVLISFIYPFLSRMTLYILQLTIFTREIMQQCVKYKNY